MEKRKRKADLGALSKEQPPKKKLPVKPTQKSTPVDTDIDSGDESDGQSALRKIEERDRPKGARRGPGNEV